MMHVLDHVKTSEHWGPDLYRITQSASKLPHASGTEVELESGHTKGVISKLSGSVICADAEGGWNRRPVQGFWTSNSKKLPCQWRLLPCVRTGQHCIEGFNNLKRDARLRSKEGHQYQPFIPARSTLEMLWQ